MISPSRCPLRPRDRPGQIRRRPEEHPASYTTPRDTIKKFGEEVATALRAKTLAAMDKSEQMVQTDAAALRGAFSVSGELIKTDEASNRTLGKFTLSGQGNGFAVRIDSEKGAFVSSGDGPFTSDFARITPPQLRNLPYFKAIADTLNVKV